MTNKGFNRILHNDDGTVTLCPCHGHDYDGFWEMPHGYELCEHHARQYPEPIREALTYQPGTNRRSKWAHLVGASESLYFHKAFDDADGWIELVEIGAHRSDPEGETSRWVHVSQIRSCGFGR